MKHSFLSSCIYLLTIYTFCGLSSFFVHWAKRSSSMAFMATAGNTCVIVLSMSATPVLEVATNLLFIFASQSKKPACKSIFHLAKAITDAQRGAVTYSKRQKCFYTVWTLFPRGSYLFATRRCFTLRPSRGGSRSLFPTILSQIF